MAESALLSFISNSKIRDLGFSMIFWREIIKMMLSVRVNRQMSVMFQFT